MTTSISDSEDLSAATAWRQRSGPRRRGASVTLALLMLAVAPAAIAANGQSGATAPGATQAAARELGKEGVRLAAAGDCQRALPKLQQAESLFHAPTLALPLAECHIALGQLVRGTQLLADLSVERLPKGAPKAFVAAKRKAAELLKVTAPRLARLTLEVSAPAGTVVKLTMDGKEIPWSDAAKTLVVDPGTHQALAVAPGLAPVEVSTQLAEGEHGTLRLTLAPQPASRAARWGVYLSYGIGAAGLAGGAVFGGLALSKAGDLDKDCKNGACPKRARADIDSLDTLSTLSTVGFGVGIAGATVGTLLLLLRSDGQPEATPQASSEVRVAPWATGNALGITGTF